MRDIVLYFWTRKCFLMYSYIICFLPLIPIVSCWKIHFPLQRFSWSTPRTKCYSSLQPFDVSPLKDRGILKTILSEGNNDLMPSYGDTVTIILERHDDTGKVKAHPDLQSPEDYKLTFDIGQDQDVFNGIHYGVLSMAVGEIARIDFTSAYANPGIAKNVSCRITLLEVKPPLQVYDQLNFGNGLDAIANGNIDGDTNKMNSVFQAQLEANAGQNPLAKEIYKGTRRNSLSPTYYDSAKHKLDPRREIDGIGSDHTWSENIDTIEVFVPLPPYISAKSDISVIIKKNEIWVKKAPVVGTNMEENEDVVLFGGPLYGFIKPSGSNWALEENKGLFMKGLRVVLSLEKAYGHQELWSSVLNRQYLSNSNTVIHS